jgi:predicted ferric reductase
MIKMKNKTRKPIKITAKSFGQWTRQHAKLIIITLLIFYVYATFHELVHAFTAHLLGYSGRISFTATMFLFTFKNTPKLGDFLLTTISPYLISLLILLILYILNIFYHKERLFARIAFFPMIDILINFLCAVPAALFNFPDDFWLVLKVGLILGWIEALIATVFIIILIWMSFVLYKPFLAATKELWIRKKEKRTLTD